jgi:hypothetical protein
MDEPALRFIGSLRDFFFSDPPVMASFKKSSFKFCPKSVSFATRQYHYFVG